MGLRNTARVEAVKRLREVAARLGVARAPDNAGRQKVEAMRQAILAAYALADAESSSTSFTTSTTCASPCRSA